MMERASRFRAGGFSPGTDATLGFGASVSREAGRRQEFAPSSFQALASSGPEDDAGLLTTHGDDLVEPSFEYFHEASDDDEGQNDSILNGSPPAPPAGSPQERARASEGRRQVHEHEQERKQLLAHEEAQRLEVEQEQAKLLQQQQMLAAIAAKPQHEILFRENPRSAGTLLAQPPSLHQAQGEDHQPEPQQVFLRESQQSQSRALQQSEEPYMARPPITGPRPTTDRGDQPVSESEWGPHSSSGSGQEADQRWGNGKSAMAESGGALPSSPAGQGGGSSIQREELEITREEVKRLQAQVSELQTKVELLAFEQKTAQQASQQLKSPLGQGELTDNDLYWYTVL